MGVSVVGLSEEKYTAITYEATSILSELLYGLNPDLVFNYVSGTGTDSSEKGSLMWARVKGRAENKILNQGFKDAYAFRPGAIIPERGIKSSTLMYNLFYIISRPLFPLLRRMDSITTSSRLGQAMINSVLRGTPLKHLENTDIIITSYGTLRRDIEILKEIDFEYCILDEAQALPDESLEALRLFTNLETERRKLLQVVLLIYQVLIQLYLQKLLSQEVQLILVVVM